MRVSIESKKQTQTSGLIFRKTKPYVSVYVTVDFSDEELAIIEENGLHDLVILDREPDPIRYEKIQDMHYADDPDTWALKVKRLIEEKPHEYRFATPVAAKEYEQELKEALQRLKAHLDASATVEDGPDQFEL